MSVAAAARAVAARRWFQAVHRVRYWSQKPAAPASRECSFSQPVVARDVEGNRHADGADEVERAPDEHGREWRPSHGDQGPHQPGPRQAAAVPKSAVMKAGVTATMMMDCIAAMPCAAGNRLSEAITKLRRRRRPRLPARTRGR